MSDQKDGLSRRTVLKHSALATGTLVGGGVAATGTAAAGIGDGRVGHYHLNNIRPDGTVIDASPEDNHGTNHGASVVRDGGKVGNAFEFGGDDKVVVEDFDWSGGPVTVSFWNYVTETDVGRSSAFGGGKSNSDRFQAHAPWKDKMLYWDYGNYSGTGRISTNYREYLNAWTHVTLVSEGSAGDYKAIYLNGKRITESDTSDGPGAMNSNLAIGRRPLAPSGRYHTGKIDEFRIYDRVLSKSEVQSLAAMGGNSGGKGNGRGRGN